MNAHDLVTSARGGPGPYRAVEPSIIIIILFIYIYIYMKRYNVRKSLDPRFFKIIRHSH
jgi:hypothetical protein